MPSPTLRAHPSGPLAFQRSRALARFIGPFDVRESGFQGAWRETLKTPGWVKMSAHYLGTQLKLFGQASQSKQSLPISLPSTSLNTLNLFPNRYRRDALTQPK